MTPRILSGCAGPECVRQGSLELLRAIQVARGPAATDGRLVVRPSGCLARCAEAITLGLFPERVFRQHARPDQSEAILAECLDDGPRGPAWRSAPPLPTFLRCLERRAAGKSVAWPDPAGV